MESDPVPPPTTTEYCGRITLVEMVLEVFHHRMLPGAPPVSPVPPCVGGTVPTDPVASPLATIQFCPSETTSTLVCCVEVVMLAEPLIVSPAAAASVKVVPASVLK